MKAFGAFALVAACLALTGCGNPEPAQDAATADGLNAAYARFEQAILAKNEKVFCEMISDAYRRKLSAAYERADSDCAGLFAEVAKNERESTPAERGKFKVEQVSGWRGSGLLTSEYKGKTTRTRLYFKRRTGKWILTDDRELDDLGPAAPSAAYRQYVLAVSRGDGPLACSLMTDRARSRLAGLGVSPGEPAQTCEQAVTKIASHVAGVSAPQIEGGEVDGNISTLSVVQGDDLGHYVARIVLMHRVNGHWLFDYSQDRNATKPLPTSGTGPQTVV